MNCRRSNMTIIIFDCPPRIRGTSPKCRGLRADISIIPSGPVLRNMTSTPAISGQLAICDGVTFSEGFASLAGGRQALLRFLNSVSNIPSYLWIPVLRSNNPLHSAIDRCVQKRFGVRRLRQPELNYDPCGIEQFGAALQQCRSTNDYRQMTRENMETLHGTALTVPMRISLDNCADASIGRETENVREGRMSSKNKFGFAPGRASPSW